MQVLAVHTICLIFYSITTKVAQKFHWFSARMENTRITYNCIFSLYFLVKNSVSCSRPVTAVFCIHQVLFDS